MHTEKPADSQGWYDLNSAGRQRVDDDSKAIDFDFQRAHATLQERIGEVATALFGRPNAELSTRDQLRFGTNGSIAIEIAGPKAGTYFDHEHKRGGGVRELLEFEGGIKRGQDQIAWLRDKIGFETPLPKTRRTIAKTYDYRDEAGALLFQVCRFEPKSFAQRRPDPTSQTGYSWKVKNVRQVLYRLPELLAADPALPVFLVEGEKDCENVAALGLTATTNPGGANKWRDSYNEALAGRHVVLLPDNDPTGRKHVEHVAFRVSERVASVRIVELPSLDPKGDVSDWLAVGGTREQLLQLADAAPLFVLPETPKPEPSTVKPVEGSEDYFADAFSRQFADDYRYTPGLGRLRYDGARYAPDDTVRVFEDARQIARRFARDFSDPDFASAKVVGAIEKMARSDPRHARSVHDWDQDKWLLNCPNGTVELRTGELREHRRDDNITRRTNATPNPNARCPIFESFLSRVANGSEELRSFILRVAGMSLVGVQRDHVVIIHHGNGRNGKSTFINVQNHLLGDYCRHAMAETFVASKFEHHSTDLFHLRGARLAAVAEIDKGKSWDLAKLKRFTGGDTITARKMRGDPIEFVPEATLQVACNFLPGISTLDAAIKERLVVVPWKVFLPEGGVDTELFEKLKGEADAILSLFIDGCLEWQHMGLARPQAVLDATERYIKQEDFFGQWLEQRCIFDSAYSEELTALFGDYTAWCRERTVDSLGRHTWRDQLAERAPQLWQSGHYETRRAILNGIALRLDGDAR